VYAVLESGVLDFYSSKRSYLDFSNAANEREFILAKYELRTENLPRNNTMPYVHSKIRKALTGDPNVSLRAYFLNNEFFSLFNLS